MRIAQINMMHNGSTGKIMFQIAKVARSCGHEVLTCSAQLYNKGEKKQTFVAPDHFVWGTHMGSWFHYHVGALLGRNGLFSRKSTKRLVAKLREFNPDVIHLHNVHKFCVHLPTLFRYIKESNVKVVWTLHDCWSFTGHCGFFSLAKCDKWKTGCGNCPALMAYPKTYIDNTAKMYRRKREWFSGIQDMTLVAPSRWLAGLVKQSFLKDYPVEIIGNGIDLSVFTPQNSDFRERYRCEEKKVVLGVAFAWGERKGLDVFLELSKRLNPEKYQIVLVGTNDTIDQQLPRNIISIHRTANQLQLAEIYSVADLFLNPTREDNYPTVNMEAIACGTPVLTFNTDGSPEMVDETTGSVVPCDDIDALEAEVKRICEQTPYTKEDCLYQAKTRFDMNEKFNEYVLLYEQKGKREE